MKNTIDVFASIAQPIRPSFLSKIILFLQFLQAELHSTNGSGVKTFISQFETKIVAELTQLWENMCLAYEDLLER